MVFPMEGGREAETMVAIIFKGPPLVAHFHPQDYLFKIAAAAAGVCVLYSDHNKHT